MSELAGDVVATLGRRDLTLATAESLTGGLLGARITAVPGASAVYVGGVVAYSPGVKSGLLGVEPSIMDAVGTVSEECVRLMAAGATARTGADWGIAVSGVAGPDPLEGHEPGEVWVGIAGPVVGSLPQPLFAEMFRLTGDREAVRNGSVDAALRMLLRVLAPG